MDNLIFLINFSKIMRCQDISTFNFDEKLGHIKN